MCVVQKNSTNGCQSDLKLQASIKKKHFSNFECYYLPICTVKLHEIFTT